MALHGRGIHGLLMVIVAVVLALVTGLAASSVLFGIGVESEGDRTAREPHDTEQAGQTEAPLIRLQRALTAPAAARDRP